MNYESTHKIIETEFEKELLPNLSEFIKIDNLSPFFDVEWNTNGKLETAAKFCVNWVNNQNIVNLKSEIIKDDDKSPLIFCEIDKFNTDDDRTTLIYGHFDKQPHFTGWAEGLGPCTPVIKDGKLYGRGGADDGYSIFSAIAAIKAIQQLKGKHNRIVIIVEGSEESGSPHLMPYISKLNERIGKPSLLICLDSGCLDYDRLWVTTSLRGCVMADLTVEVLNEAVHSGCSGLVADSFSIIRTLLDRVQDSKTGIVVKDFEVEIPENVLKEAKEVADLLKEKVYTDIIKLKENTLPISQDNTELLLNSTWKPTLTITGASGLPNHETAGNVLRAFTTLRLSLRLPPTFDGNKAGAILEQILTKDPPSNSKVTVQQRAPGSGWNNKEFSSKLQESLSNSSKKLWNNEFVNFGMGGSIPFIKQLADNYPECETVVIGVLGPGSNAHSCNESLDINYCKNITTTVAHLLNDF